VATASGAYAILKARFEANKPAGLTALRWQNQNEDSTGAIALPDTPAAFAYVEFETDPQQLAGYGGGRGANLYRNPARLQILVFVPKGQGLVVATDLAEACATIFRSYRDSSLSCFEASVFPGGDGAEMMPPGLSSAAGNYYWAGVEVGLFFDQVG
jgi:hypothetical protein